MTDSRRKSLVEIGTGKCVSFAIGYFLNWGILSAYGIQGNVELYSTISGVAVLIATFRSYLWRRMFNRLSIFEENGTHFNHKVTA